MQQPGARGPRSPTYPEPSAWHCPGPVRQGCWPGRRTPPGSPGPASRSCRKVAQGLSGLDRAGSSLLPQDRQGPPHSSLPKQRGHEESLCGAARGRLSPRRVHQGVPTPQVPPALPCPPFRLQPRSGERLVLLPDCSYRRTPLLMLCVGGNSPPSLNHSTRTPRGSPSSTEHTNSAVPPTALVSLCGVTRTERGLPGRPGEQGRRGDSGARPWDQLSQAASEEPLSCPRLSPALQLLPVSSRAVRALLVGDLWAAGQPAPAVPCQRREGLSRLPPLHSRARG